MEKLLEENMSLLEIYIDPQEMFYKIIKHLLLNLLP